MARKKPGRNDPCWCGSGEKYKRCHLRADEEEARSRRGDADLDGLSPDPLSNWKRAEIATLAE